jgi:hypothetical protein
MENLIRVSLIIIRATLFEELELGGKNYQFLVGTRLSEMGKTMEQNCLAGTRTTNISFLPRRALITCAGVDNIPSLYGFSFRAAEVIYALSYLLFLGLFVTLVGAQFSEPG